MKNIKTNITLEQYNKKYRNRNDYLIRISKKEVEAFYKKHPKQGEYYLLKKNKWALIGDTYYEIPKTFSLVWFTNIGIVAQVALCGALCAGVSSAVVFPTLANTVWKKSNSIVETPRDPNWITKNNWYDLTSNATSNDVGKSVKIKVNGLEHEVILIDVDKDDDANGNKIHTTWHFANPICDEDGYSLAYQFRDCLDSVVSKTAWSGKQIDYYNSSLNFALNGTGTNGFKNISDDDPNYTDEEKQTYKDAKVDVGAENEDILVLRHNQTYWETRNSTYTKPIISMIPSEITNKMKPVSKVNNNKLFVLSSKEIKGGYSYYSYTQTLKGRVRRIKSQINQNNPGEAAYQNITPKTDEKRIQLFAYKGVQGRAGSNESCGIPGAEVYAGYYWCRDLGIKGTTGYQYINRVSYKGNVGPGDPIRDAYGVVPAFCI